MTGVVNIDGLSIFMTKVTLTKDDSRATFDAGFKHIVTKRDNQIIFKSDMERNSSTSLNANNCATEQNLSSAM